VRRWILGARYAGGATGVSHVPPRRPGQRDAVHLPERSRRWRQAAAASRIFCTTVVMTRRCRSLTWPTTGTNSEQRRPGKSRDRSTRSLKAFRPLSTTSKACLAEDQLGVMRFIMDGQLFELTPGYATEVVAIQRTIATTNPIMVMTPETVARTSAGLDHKPLFSCCHRRLTKIILNFCHLCSRR
jgi:hypothetical protein